jgi:hypothetical protein
MKIRYALDDEERRTIAISFKMKASHYDKLIKLSKEEDRSKTSLMERALVEYFKKKKL